MHHHWETDVRSSSRQSRHNMFDTSRKQSHRWLATLPRRRRWWQSVNLSTPKKKAASTHGSPAVAHASGSLSAPSVSVGNAEQQKSFGKEEPAVSNLFETFGEAAAPGNAKEANLSASSDPVLAAIAALRDDFKAFS